MQIVVHATDIPPVPGMTVGVQRRGRPAELLDPVETTSNRTATWTLTCEVRERDGALDVTGTHVEGRPGGRFVYLTWRRNSEVVRRAKLMLDAVPPEVLAAATTSALVVARLGLTDERGGPVCAAVRPPRITWSAEQPA